jgi:hypothetical protein
MRAPALISGPRAIGIGSRQRWCSERATRQRIFRGDVRYDQLRDGAATKAFDSTMGSRSGQRS